MREFAGRLIACEAREDKSSGTKNPAAFPIHEKLRLHLATFMGNGGFRALLKRALHLASAEVEGLRAAHVNADGTMGGLEELAAQSSPKEIFDARVVLLAHVLGLLVTFIGPIITQRLLHDVWPEIKEI